MRLVRTVFLIILAIQSTACERRQDPGYVQVKDAFQSNQGLTISLSEHTDFEWDRVHFFGPYIPYDLIQNRTGYVPPTDLQQKYVEGENPLVPETSCVIVFTNNSDLVFGSLHPRCDFDSSNFSDMAFSRGFAQFFLAPRGDQCGPRLEYPGEPNA